MKAFPYRLFVILAVFSMLISSCSTPATPTTPTDTVQAPAPTSLPTRIASPTAAPLPTLQPTPTQTPPIPCTITFDSDRDGNREIYVMGPDGSEPLNLSNNPTDDRNPVWSPDGSRIVFVSDRDGGQFLYTMNADGSDVRQLTTENGSDWPDWSQDGRKITYTANDDIYSIIEDGSQKSINLTNSPEKDSQSAWSPDSKQIAWLVGDGFENRNIFVMDTDGKNERQITQDNKVSDVAWTVDGQLFTHWKNDSVGCFNCVMNADGSNVTDAGGKGEIQRYLPFWTLDGNRVELANGDILTSDDEIYLVSEIYPDIFLNLTNNPANDRNADWPALCGPENTAALSALQQPETIKEIVIGYAGDDQWQGQRKENFQLACNELGIECIYGELPELIAQGVSAVVHNSNNIIAPGLHADILKARDAGIPVFVLDAEIITHGSVSITIDHRIWAEKSLDWMLNEMGGKGDFAFFDFQPYNGHSNVIWDMLSKYPNVKVVKDWNLKYDRSNIFQDVAALMKSSPNLGGIWSSETNSDIVFGVMDIGLSGDKWPVLMCDATKLGLYIWYDRLQEFPGMRCIAFSNPPGIAYDAVYAAYYLASGYEIDPAVLSGEFGQSLYVDFPVVTQDTLEEWLEISNPEPDTYIVDQRMTHEEILERWFLEK
ncbi:MAG: substrate-binding domain-containing protein [Anaerolineaceae bacterium]